MDQITQCAPVGNDTDLFDNPMGTDGFEFVEFAALNPAPVVAVLESMGFSAVAHHRSKKVTLYRQGRINFILNAEPDSSATEFASLHGASVNAMAFRVRDAAAVYRRALDMGAEGVPATLGPMELNIPAIRGIGGSLLYLVDRYGERGSIYDVDFAFIPGVDRHPAGVGLTYIDHLTHNVMRGAMDTWSSFYERLFNFREIKYFDIEGKKTGLKSRAMTSPCGKIRIPINESADDKSQIEEFIRQYNGEGIQHIALGTDDIYQTVRVLNHRKVPLQDTVDAYYDLVERRVPCHQENLDALRELKILIDGAPTKGQGLLLQIFTQTLIGPIFFEIIQRKGNDGFGEGNFKALFESIELDQMRRGVI